MSRALAARFGRSDRHGTEQSFDDSAERAGGRCTRLAIGAPLPRAISPEPDKNAKRDGQSENEQKYSAARSPILSLLHNGETQAVPSENIFPKNFCWRFRQFAEPAIVFA